MTGPRPPRASNHITFTQVVVERIRPPKTGRVIYWDSLLPSFGLLVSAPRAGHNAHKAWITMYRDANRKLVFETLGTCALIPKLKDARERARERRRAAQSSADIAQAGLQEPVDGKRPIVEPRNQKRAYMVLPKDIQFDAAVEDYLEHCAKGKKPNKSTTIQTKRRIFEHYLKPQWGAKGIHQISRKDVEDLIKLIGSRRERRSFQKTGGAHAQANNVLAELKTFFSWAIKEEHIAVAPTAQIEAPFENSERDRVLDDDEIKLLWRVCVALGYPFGPLHQLLLLLGQRLREVGGMRRDELSQFEAKGLWTIPKERTKNGKTHIVPMTGLAAEIIEGLLLSAPGTEFVFTISGERAIADYHGAKARINRLMLEYRRQELAAAGLDPGNAKIEHWVVHDLRRTATTGMTELGHPPHVVDKILNHTPRQSGRGGLSGSHRIYDRFEYLPERKKALEGWGQYVKDLVS